MKILDNLHETKTLLILSYRALGACYSLWESFPWIASCITSLLRSIKTKIVTKDLDGGQGLVIDDPFFHESQL